MSPRVFALLVAIVAAASAPLPAQADLVVRYDFTGSTGDQISEAPDQTIAGVVAGNLGRGPGVTAASGADSINSSAWTTGGGDNTDYYGFTLTPNSDTTLTLTRLSFAERRSNTGIRNFDVRSSLDSFASAIAGTFTTVPDDSNTRQQSFTLSPAFANLTVAVTFRIWGYASEAGSGTWRLSNYDGSAGGSFSGGLVVEGTATLAAVPEASAATFAAAASCLSALAWACRRSFAKR